MVFSNRLFNRACRTDATVLLTGPAGSGKTTLARQIHEQSLRREGPFVSIHLATLPVEILESELERAQGGTVLLDEVCGISPWLQVRLLDFLRSRELTPVGSDQKIPLDVRVIAATHKDLSKAVANGDFREDLFQYLQVIPIHLQALQERIEEMDTLVHSTLSEVTRGLNRTIKRISAEVAERFETYSWPGNLRELRNVMEFAVQSCEGSEITLTHLPEGLTSDLHLEQFPMGSAILGVAEPPLNRL